MGRPKAVRGKDKTPAIDINQKSTKITFNDSDNEPENVDVVPEVRRSTRKRKPSLVEDLGYIPPTTAKLKTPSKKAIKENDASDDESSAPEIVHAQNEEVLQLKRQHAEEELSQSKSVKKRRKSRKVEEGGNASTQTQAAVEDGNDAIDGLDASVLEAVAQYQADGDLEADSDAEKETPERRYKGSRKIVINKVKSKKIGNITVTALENSRSNSTSAFSISTDAKAFLDQQMQNVPRVRYSRFAGQKSSGPAKKFRI